MSLDDLHMFQDPEYKNMKGREDLLQTEFLYRIAVSLEENTKQLAEINKNLRTLAQIQFKTGRLQS